MCVCVCVCVCVNDQYTYALYCNIPVAGVVAAVAEVVAVEGVGLSVVDGGLQRRHTHTHTHTH